MHAIQMQRIFTSGESCMRSLCIFQCAFNHIVYKALLLLAVYHWSPGLASRGLKLHYTVLRGGRKAVSRLMKA